MFTALPVWGMRTSTGLSGRFFLAAPGGTPPSSSSSPSSSSAGPIPAPGTAAAHSAADSGAQSWMALSIASFPLRPRSSTSAPSASWMSTPTSRRPSSSSPPSGFSRSSSSTCFAPFFMRSSACAATRTFSIAKLPCATSGSAAQVSMSNSSSPSAPVAYSGSALELQVLAVSPPLSLPPPVPLSLAFSSVSPSEPARPSTMSAGPTPRMDTGFLSA